MPREKRDTVLNISLRRSIVTSIKVIAVENGISMADVVEDAIQAYVGCGGDNSVNQQVDAINKRLDTLEKILK